MESLPMSEKPNPIIRACMGLVALLLVCSSHAGQSLNIDEDGIALRGYDPVSYHLSGEPLQGSSRYSAVYSAARFLFDSSENRERFLASPERYVPAYGGFCSYGVRVGKKFDGDPLVWRLVGGRLYLQLDHGTQRVWIKDMQKNITVADKLWPSVQSQGLGE